MLGIDSLMNPALRMLYGWRSATPLEARKPRLKWLPKYSVPVQLPDGVLRADAPTDEVEGQLADMGFEIEHWTRDELVLSRGKAWADFSLRWIKVRVALPLPLEPSTHMTVMIAKPVLFDTGDLWDLSQELSGALADGSRS